jgi:hypothetical protein
VDPQRYARVKEIFREAMRWAPEERAAVVAELAGDDPVVRDEVQSLLAHHDDAPLIREPAPGDGRATDPPARPEAPAQQTGRAAGSPAPSAATTQEAGRAAGSPSPLAAPPPSAPTGTGHDLVEGRTLAALLRTERDARAGGAPAGWPLERVVRVLDPIAEALAIAADRGVVHGAVRVDQVVLAEVGGEVIAQLVGLDAAHAAGPQAGSASRIEGGAAASAAPEQVLPALGPTGPWTDVYALALLCVELMLGRPVAEGGAIAALARARDEAAQPTPRAVGLDVPAAVEVVMAMAMAMRPMERYQDVRRFWRALRDSLAASRPVPPAPPSQRPSSSTSRPQRRHRAWAALGIAVLALGAAVAIVQRCG